MYYKLTGKIVDIKGKCEASHEVGEEIDLTIYGKEGIAKSIKLCPYFMYSLFPYLCVMQFGGQFPQDWEKDLNVFVAERPDFETGVKIRVERIPVKEQKVKANYKNKQLSRKSIFINSDINSLDEITLGGKP